MNVEMGKKYILRCGHPYRLYCIDGIHVHGAYEPLLGPWEMIHHNIDGCAYTKGHWFDLVEIPPEPTYLPFTSEELPRIVGRHVRRKANPGESMIVTWAKVTGFVVAGQFSVCREALLRDWQFIDFDANGKEIVTPCGVVVEATP